MSKERLTLLSFQEVFNYKSTWKEKLETYRKKNSVKQISESHSRDLSKPPIPSDVRSLQRKVENYEKIYEDLKKLKEDIAKNLRNTQESGQKFLQKTQKLQQSSQSEYLEGYPTSRLKQIPYRDERPSVDAFNSAIPASAKENIQSPQNKSDQSHLDQSGFSSKHLEEEPEVEIIETGIPANKYTEIDQSQVASDTEVAHRETQLPDNEKSISFADAAPLGVTQSVQQLTLQEWVPTTEYILDDDGNEIEVFREDSPPE